MTHNHNTHLPHEHPPPKSRKPQATAHGEHDHKSIIEDYKRRLIVSGALTIPVLLLSPSIQSALGYKITFPGNQLVLWILSSIIYVYGGQPFLKGLVSEVKKRLPGMMTLIGVAISVAYFYSTAVTFVLKGQTFYWELATLIDVMLLGHVIEMKTIAGSSRALEILAKSIPTTAYRVRDDGSI